MNVTYKKAHSVGWDAGNRNMRANGRTKWNEEDWNVAAKVMNELMELVSE